METTSHPPPPLPLDGKRAWPARFFAGVTSSLEYLFGLLTILLSLAILSAIPILHFLSLGYLLESSARVARTGRIRDGFVGLRPAAWIGRILVAGWLLFLPIRLIHSYWRDATVIDPGGEAETILRVVLAVSLSATVLLVAWAILRGGRFRHFLWPAPFRFLGWMGRPGKWEDARKGFVNLEKSTHLLRLLETGFFGFLGGTLWLIIPVLILFGAARIANPGLSLLTSLAGGILLGFVALHLPFAQTRYAVTRRFSEFRSFRGAREAFRRAPLALWAALFVTLLFSLPLYLLKIELAPQEIAWIPNLVFVVFMFPARLLTGWAMSRSLRREQSSHWSLRLLSRIAVLPAILVYVFIVWLTQYLSWHGSYSLFEQHAFLLPAPMLGL